MGAQCSKEPQVIFFKTSVVKTYLKYAKIGHERGIVFIFTDFPDGPTQLAALSPSLSCCCRAGEGQDHRRNTQFGNKIPPKERDRAFFGNLVSTEYTVPAAVPPAGPEALPHSVASCYGRMPATIAARYVGSGAILQFHDGGHGRQVYHHACLR